MELIGKLILQDFWQQDRRARRPLEKWIQVVEQAEWRNFAEIRQTFGNADLVPVRDRKYVVFDVGGNKYRLITIVNYQGQIVIVEVALSHSEYDKDKWKD